MKLFISYRRDDSQAVTGRIYDRLILPFGKEGIFKDVYSIPLGSDFRHVLSDGVKDCDVVLVVIGPEWLKPRGRGRERRIDDATDYVRVEIEEALKHGLIVIPVLVEGAAMPSPENLPAEISALSYRNAHRIRNDPDFHSDMDRMIQSLKAINPSKAETPGELARRTISRVTDRIPPSIAARIPASWMHQILMATSWLLPDEASSPHLSVQYERLLRVLLGAVLFVWFGGVFALVVIVLPIDMAVSYFRGGNAASVTTDPEKAGSKPVPLPSGANKSSGRPVPPFTLKSEP